MQIFFMTHMSVLELEGGLRLSLPLPGALIASGIFGHAESATALKLYKFFFVLPMRCNYNVSR